MWVSWVSLKLASIHIGRDSIRLKTGTPRSTRSPDLQAHVTDDAGGRGDHAHARELVAPGVARGARGEEARVGFHRDA